MRIKRVIAFLTAFTAVFSTDAVSSANLVTNAENNEVQELYGDLDDSKNLDSMDLVLMKKAVAKKAEYNVKADLDNDNDVDEDDIQLLSDYILRNNRCFPVYVKFDSDGDGINDFAEIEAYHTDIHKTDTDNDGISDQDEIYRTKTDPAVYDSVKKGTSDAETDIDEDGLPNSKELQIGSDPRNADSDGDGLDDGHEAEKTKTSPVTIDTDGDGITDYEETELGLDPLNTQTDGTPDNERIFTQVIAADDPIFAGINTDDNAYDLSVEIEASGYAKRLLDVKESGYSYAMKNGSAIGIVPEFTYNDDFKVKSITINFNVKEPFVDNVSHYFENTDGDYEIDAEIEGIKRFNIFKYFENISLAMPIYTEYDVDSNIVKVTVDTFETDDDGNLYDIGSYALVDLEVWSDIMNSGSEMEAETTGDIQDNNEENLNKSEIIKKTVPELNDSLIDLLCKNYEAITPSVEKHEGIVSVFGHRYRLYDTSEMEYPGISPQDAINSCRDKGGHLMTITSQFEYKLLKEILAAGKSGFYRLGGTGDRDYWTWITGESTDYLNTIQSDNYDPESHGQYFEVFNHNLVYCAGHEYKLEDRPAVLQPSGYICEWEPGEAVTDSGSVPFISGIGNQEILKAKLDPDNGIDTDGDGVSDWDELDHEALRKLGAKTGEISVLWETALDYVKNRKINSRQPNGWDNKVKKNLKTTKSITPAKTSLVEEDSDHDGIPDSRDAMPNEPFDSIFELTKSFETVDTNDNIDQFEKAANDCYAQADIDDMDTINDIIRRAKKNIKFGRDIGWIHAPGFMNHFLENTGKDRFYNCTEVVKNTNAADFYDKYMNEVRELCENTVLDKLRFKTVSSVSPLATNFSSEDIRGMIFLETNTMLASDWWFSIGNTDAAISLECSKNGNTYTATVRYYILDYYDWNEGSEAFGGFVKDGEMYILHNVGKAKEFKSIGTYETEMTWEKGERLDVDPLLELCIDEGLRRARNYTRRPLPTSFAK